MGLHVPKNWKFCNYDADGMGRKIGRAVLANDLDDIRHQSDLIAAGHDLVKRWVKDRDGIWIMGGGDEGAFAISPEECRELEELRKDYEYLVGATISIGIGKTPAEAGKALLMAKIKGKNRIVYFNRKASDEIAAIKKRAKKGIFRSVEEHKLADAYLNEVGKVSMNKNEPFEKPEAVECEWCSKTDGIDPDHCPYCHDQEMEQECKYCSYNNPVATTRMDMPELAEQDCPFCQEMDQKGQDECKYCNDNDLAPAPAEESSPAMPEKIAPKATNPSPDSTNASAQAGSPEEKAQYDIMGMNPPVQGKPDPAKEGPIRQASPMTNIPTGSDPLLDNPQPPGTMEPRLQDHSAVDPEDNHSKDALQAIAQQIEMEGKPAQSKVDSIDDAAIPSGSNAEGNVSRVDDYEQNVPGDMGFSGPNPPSDSGEDEPDMYGLLEEGLEHNADGIAKEKAIRSVSQALQQFKASKDQLESLKMQVPQLYQASIAMLRAMIDMAGMLGLGQPGEAPAGESQLGQEQASLMPEAPQASAQPENEWSDPFPLHPDQGGEAKPGHSPASKAKEGPPSPQR